MELQSSKPVGAMVVDLGRLRVVLQMEPFTEVKLAQLFLLFTSIVAITKMAGVMLIGLVTDTLSTLCPGYGMKQNIHSSNMFIVMRIFIIFLMISSCSSKIDQYLPERPSRSFVGDLEGEASPEFLQGWKDGCEAGMATGSNTFYKMFYRVNKVDGFKMVSSGDYSTAWSNAWAYCVRYDAVKQKSSIWGSTFGGYR